MFISCWVCGLTVGGNGVGDDDALEEGVEPRDMVTDEGSEGVDDRDWLSTFGTWEPDVKAVEEGVDEAFCEQGLVEGKREGVELEGVRGARGITESARVAK